MKENKFANLITELIYELQPQQITRGKKEKNCHSNGSALRETHATQEIVHGPKREPSGAPGHAKRNTDENPQLIAEKD